MKRRYAWIVSTVLLSASTSAVAAPSPLQLALFDPFLPIANGRF